MIKINLLNSVTERQTGVVTAVDRKISSGGSRLLLMSVVVAVLLAAVVGWDVISSQMARTEAARQLDEQKQIAADLAVVTNELNDLDQKMRNIDARINAIKDLRSKQAGPSAVLEAMRERVAMTPGLYLASVEQKGDSLIFKGNSPDEAQVTQFGRSLEFSSGLFSNLSIETVRAEVTNESAPVKVSTTAGGSETPKVQIVNFTITCLYTPSKATGADNGNPSTASAQTPANAPNQGAQPAQVAKK